MSANRLLSEKFDALSKAIKAELDVLSKTIDLLDPHVSRLKTFLTVGKNIAKKENVLKLIPPKGITKPADALLANKNRVNEAMASAKNWLQIAKEMVGNLSQDKTTITKLAALNLKFKKITADLTTLKSYLPENANSENLYLKSFETINSLYSVIKDTLIMQSEIFSVENLKLTEELLRECTLAKKDEFINAATKFVSLIDGKIAQISNTSVATNPHAMLASKTTVAGNANKPETTVALRN